MLEALLMDPPSTFDDFLAEEQAKDLLRFTTAGSVDDGKSTLIGRLLYDSRSVYEDQLESVAKASVGRNAGGIDFSLLTDGLRAEREQGITIDVAYRYFATPKRKFIIADTPGHEQYTRNMVTGASTAELAVVLVDARKGVLPQSRRHTYISSLLGLPHLVVAVNKMDLVNYDQGVFDGIESEFRRFLSSLGSIQPYFVPISALAGDNVVTRSLNMPWFRGPSLLEFLETVPVGHRRQLAEFRFPVQRVVRPDLDFRGYAGTVASGTVSVGEPVTVLPSGRSSHIARIVTFDGDLPEAHAGQSVTLTLADEVDISRGDLIVPEAHRPHSATSVAATVVWLSADPAVVGKRYRIKHAAALQSADLAGIEYRININTGESEHAATLEMNAIGSVRIETARPLVFDSYTENRITGSFILIDAVTNATIAAGLLSGPVQTSAAIFGSKNAKLRPLVPVTAKDRIARAGHIGARIDVGANSELGWRLERALFDRGCTVFRLDQPSSVVNHLVELSALVITAGSASAITVETEWNSMAVAEASVAAVEAALERLQVFSTSQTWTDSGGI